jgi:hypothetical protein
MMETLTAIEPPLTQQVLLRKMAAVALLGMRENHEDDAQVAMQPVITASGNAQSLEVFMAFAAALGDRPQRARELLALREATVEPGALDAVLALGLQCAGDPDGGRALQRLLSLVDDAPTRQFIVEVNSALEAIAA